MQESPSSPFDFSDDVALADELEASIQEMTDVRDPDDIDSDEDTSDDVEDDMITEEDRAWREQTLPEVDRSALEDRHEPSDDAAEVIDELSIRDAGVDLSITTTIHGDRGKELQWFVNTVEPRSRKHDVHVRVLKDVSSAGDEKHIVADESAAAYLYGTLPDAVCLGNQIVLDNAVVEPGPYEDSRHMALRVEADTVVEVSSEAGKHPGDYVETRSSLYNAAHQYLFVDEAWEARENLVNDFLDEYNVVHVADTEDVWICDDGIWYDNGEKRIKQILNDVLPPAFNNRREKNEILDQVKHASTTYDNPFSPGPPDDPDLQWMVPVENGLIDLREPVGQDPVPHDHEHYTRYNEVLPVEYDSDASCPRIDENLGKISSSDQMKRTLYEVIADCAMRNNDYRKTYINIGDAETGKSFLTLLMSWLFPSGGVEHMAFEKLVSDDFEGAATMDSYAVIDDDSSAKKVKPDESNAFKRFLGLGGVRTGAKHVQRESHDPISTFVINVNHAPVWEDWDDSIKSRLMPLFFNNKFVADPDPDDPDQHKKKKVSELEAELNTPCELSGLLNKVIEAANRLYDTEEWSIYDDYASDAEEAHAAMLRKYRHYADTTRRFARDFMVEVDDPVRVRKEDWHTIYRRRCAEEGLEPQGNQAFWRQILNDETVYVEYGQDNDGKRVTKHVAPSEKALEYAPGPVRDRLEDLVNRESVYCRVDEVTDLADVSRYENYATVEVTVEHRSVHPNGSVELTVRDETSMIDVLAPSSSDGGDGPVALVDGVSVGDVVRFEAVGVSQDRLIVRPVTDVDVVGFDNSVVDDVDDDGDVDTEEIVLRHVEDMDDGDGAHIGQTCQLLAGQLGWEPETARRHVESLCDAGKLERPADGRVRVV